MNRVRADRRASVAAAIVVLALLSGCATQRWNMNREDAVERLQDFVHQVHADLGGGLSAERHEEPLTWTNCTGPGGAPSELSSTAYGISVELAPGADADQLIEQVRRRWQDDGLEVTEARLGTTHPSLYTQFDQFKASFVIVKPDRKALIGGTTPCLPWAAAASAS